jgi:hypothetical protein
MKAELLDATSNFKAELLNTKAEMADLKAKRLNTPSELADLKAKVVALTASTTSCGSKKKDQCTGQCWWKTNKCQAREG